MTSLQVLGQFAEFKANQIDTDRLLDQHQSMLQSHQSALIKLNDLYSEVEKLQSSLNRLEAMTAIRSKISRPQISAFATPIPRDMNGGSSTK